MLFRSFSTSACIQEPFTDVRVISSTFKGSEESTANVLREEKGASSSGAEQKENES